MAARRSPAELAAVHRRFVAALGSEGGLELPTRPLDVAAGRSLYAQNCASCHGARGLGDGPAARGMTPAPPAIGDEAAMADRTPALLFRVISVGIAGTPMSAWGDRLTADQRWDIVAYLHQLRGVAMPPREALDPEGPTPNVTVAAAPEVVGRRVLATLDQALAAMRGGRSAEAGDLAFDAYIAFEPLETRARARRSRARRVRSSGTSPTSRGRCARNDVRGAERARDAIEAQLPGIVALTRAPTGRWATFFQSFLIILRGGPRGDPRHRRDRARSCSRRAIASGCARSGSASALALVASAATAVVLQTVLRAMPASREIIEGATMLVAVAVLFSVSYWLISKVEAAQLAAVHPREGGAAPSQHGGGSALAFVAFLAVYREGAETALFYQALFDEGRDVDSADRARDRRRRRGARGHLHALLPVRRAHSAATVLRRHERPAVLHGVRVHGEGHARAAGRQRHPDHGDPGLPVDRRDGHLPQRRDAARAAGAARAVRVRASRKPSGAGTPQKRHRQAPLPFLTPDT